MNIHQRIGLIIILVAVTLGGSIALWNDRVLIYVARQEISARAMSLATSRIESTLKQINAKNVPAAEQSLQQVVRNNEGIDYIYVVGLEGEIFAHSFDGEFPEALARISRSFKDSGVPIMRELNIWAETIQDHSLPIIEGTTARLHLGINLDRTTQVVHDSRWFTLMITLGLTVAGVLLGYLVSRRITTPLRNLTAAAEAYGRGEKEKLSDAGLSTGDRETVALARAFAHMVESHKKIEKGLQESDERLRGAVETLQEAFVLFDANDRLVMCNDEFRRLHPAPDHMLQPGTLFLDIVKKSLADGKVVEAIGREEDYLRQRLKRHQNPKGPVITKITDGPWIIINEGRTPDGGSCVTMTDITEFKRIEAVLLDQAKTLKILGKITAAANESVTVSNAIRTCLDLVCSHTGWNVGHAFLVSRNDPDVLVPTRIWHQSDPKKYTKLRELTENKKFTRSMDTIPSRVLATGEPIWFDDIQERIDAPRRKICRQIGINETFAFPIHVGSDMVAVIQFFAENPTENKETIIEIMDHVVIQLGRVFERERSVQVLNQFKTTLDKTLDCVFMFDAETLKFFYVNQGTIKQVGYTEEELMEMTPVDFSPQFTEKKFREMIDPMKRESLNAQTFESLHQHKDGSVISVEISLQYVELTGESPRFISIVRNISEDKRIAGEVRLLNESLECRVEERTTKLIREVAERRRAEENLRDAQETLLRKERLATLGQLTGTVAHELRNPLGAIATSFAVIEHKVRERGLDLSRPLDRIDRNINRCDRIITELLDFTRFNDLGSESTPLDDWLDGVLDEIEVPSGIVLRRQFAADDANVQIDSDRLRRSVINVVDNACQAMTNGGGGTGTLTIETRTRDNRLEVLVCDTGPGIPDNVLPKVFEPLFSTKTFGVGLGLPTVKQIMEQHSGGIEITSKKGEGTKVLLWLPVDGVTKNGTTP